MLNVKSIVLSFMLLAPLVSASPSSPEIFKRITNVKDCTPDNLNQINGALIKAEGAALEAYNNAISQNHDSFNKRFPKCEKECKDRVIKALKLVADKTPTIEVKCSNEPCSPPSSPAGGGANKLARRGDNPTAVDFAETGTCRVRVCGEFWGRSDKLCGFTDKDLNGRVRELLQAAYIAALKQEKIIGVDQAEDDKQKYLTQEAKSFFLYAGYAVGKLLPKLGTYSDSTDLNRAWMCQE